MTFSSNPSSRPTRLDLSAVRNALLTTLCALPLLAAHSVPPAAPPTPPPALPRGATIKLASIFPEGSVWDKAFRQMGADWRKGGASSVKLKIYPGGVAGDEPDILRKIRIGQLQGACLTVSGLAAIDPAFGFFEVPLYFESFEEVVHVLRETEDELKQRLADKGFVLLHWGHGGWIRVFSRKPVTKVEDLRALKQFTWAGDSRMEKWWRDNGFKPVPLAATDIVTGLETGLIEAVPATPLAVLSLQWFRSTEYMLDHGFLPYLGATIVSERVWKKLDEGERAAVLAAARDAEKFLFEQVPVLERSAIDEMTKRGLVTTELEGGIAPWAELGKKYAATVSSGIDGDFFERALAARNAFRARGE